MELQPHFQSRCPVLPEPAGSRGLSPSSQRASTGLALYLLLCNTAPFAAGYWLVVGIGKRSRGNRSAWHCLAW